MADFDHNPDENPNWTPKVARREYRCRECGATRFITTNHTGSVPLTVCVGKCRDVYSPNTARERVYPGRRPHDLVVSS